MTGFTGVVVAFGRSGPGDLTPIESFALRALLYWSLGTMFLALVPSGLSALPALPEPWRVALGLFAVFHGAMFTWFLRETRRLGLPVFGARENLVTIPLGTAVFLAEVLAALGFLASVAPFLYLVALLWFLFLATRVFVGLVVTGSSLEPPDA